MSFTNNRLLKELEKIKKDPVEGFELIDHTDITNWTGIIYGPPDTPYETGKFKINFRFDSDYPIKPPSVRFLNDIFHPNIYKDGKICVDILQSHEWSPAQNVRTIIQSLRSLFMDPNPSSPANSKAAQLYNSDRTEYINIVKEYISKMK